MAPEAARGARFVGAPADVFAFGVMACEILTGRPAFEDVPILSALEGRAPRRAARSASSHVPAPLSELLESCLAPEPAARPSVADLVACFRRVTR
jgi:serine/threonine protein kinase